MIYVWCGAAALSWPFNWPLAKLASLSLALSLTPLGIFSSSSSSSPVMSTSYACQSQQLLKFMQNFSPKTPTANAATTPPPLSSGRRVRAVPLCAVGKVLSKFLCHAASVCVWCCCCCKIYYKTWRMLGNSSEQCWPRNGLQLDCLALTFLLDVAAKADNKLLHVLWQLWQLFDATRHRSNYRTNIKHF